MNKDEALGVWATIRAALPDFNHNMRSLRAAYNVVCATVEAGGTHTGTLSIPNGPTVPATQRKWQNPLERVAITVRDGKVKEWAVEAVPGGGMSGLLGQLAERRRLRAAIPGLVTARCCTRSFDPPFSASKGGASCLSPALRKTIVIVPASPACPWSRSFRRAALALMGACLVACGARTQVNVPKPVASVASIATTGAAGGVDSGASNGGAGAAKLENERVSAPSTAAESPSAPAMTELHLPWSAGETWFLTSGPHSERRAALDFAPPNLDPRTGKSYADPCSRKRGDAYWVRAAADGHFSAVLRKNCPCVQIQHDDGTTTNYFHLRRSSVKKLGFKVGDRVQAGQALGHPSCEVGPKACRATHPPSGVHVHFYRTNAATAARLSANGVVLSGWRVKTIGCQRDGMMTKGDEVRETRGKLLGWACSPTTVACHGKRNDLETDLAPVLGEEAPMVSLDGDKRRQARAP